MEFFIENLVVRPTTASTTYWTALAAEKTGSRSVAATDEHQAPPRHSFRKWPSAKNSRPGFEHRRPANPTAKCASDVTAESPRLSCGFAPVVSNGRASASPELDWIDNHFRRATEHQQPGSDKDPRILGYPFRLVRCLKWTVRIPQPADGRVIERKSRHLRRYV